MENKFSVQFLRNEEIYSDFDTAYDELLTKDFGVDGQPVLARYWENAGHTSLGTFLAIVSIVDGTRYIHIYNPIDDYGTYELNEDLSSKDEQEKQTYVPSIIDLSDYVTKGELSEEVEKVINDTINGSTSNTYSQAKIDLKLDNKQDLLIIGDGIDLKEQTISANIIDDELITSQTRTYSIDKIKSLVGAPLRYKSNVATVNALSSIANVEAGDVYSVTEDKSTYAYTSEKNWVNIGTTEVDLSNYFTKKEVQDKLDEKTSVDDSLTASTDSVWSINKNKNTFVEKKTTTSSAYILDSAGNNTTKTFGSGTTANILTERNANGGLLVKNKPDSSTDAINANSLYYYRNFTSAIGNDGSTSRNVSFKADGKPVYKGAVPDSTFNGNSLSISQGYDESSGIAFDGDKIIMWSPCDGDSLRYYDEDNGGLVWKISSNGTFMSKTESRSTSAFTPDNGCTVEEQHLQICGSFVMISMRVRIPNSTNIASLNNLQIGQFSSHKSPESRLALAFSSIRNNQFTNGNPFEAYIYNGYVYIHNTDNATRTLGAAAYSISGVYPLKSNPY